MARKPYTARLEHIEIMDFKNSWPCHGLPDDLNKIVVVFDHNNEIVTIICYDEDESQLDWGEFNSPALKALTDDVRDFGERVKNA